MRSISAEEITRNVREMCIEANIHLSEDMEKAVRGQSSWKADTWTVVRES